MQLPFFKERGLDLTPFFQGTLNISIAPYTFSMKSPEYTFRHVTWTSRHPPEDFSFSRCRVLFRGIEYEGWIYYPHPETKERNFQKPTIIEIIAPQIPDLGYKATVEVKVNAKEISLIKEMMFPLKFGEETRVVTKITGEEFSAFHRETLAQVKYESGKLVFPHKRWQAIFLGAGEEKAVYCVCDHHDRVFAVEAIDERGYLNGRFVGGEYFGEMTVEGLTNIKVNPNSLLGLTFTGRIKAREFVYGYEWARFQFEPGRQRGIDLLLTNWLQSFLALHFDRYQKQYKDVHDRNVMFEIRGFGKLGVPVIMKNWLGRVQIAKVSLQPIDVR